MAFISFSIHLIGYSQLALKAKIGLDEQPNDKDSIKKTIVFFDKTFVPGPKIGDTINHFKLFSLNNQSFDVAEELSKGKPVFLISGSYTCPKYRSEILFFDSLFTAYKNVSFFVIYTMEAHPAYPDICPYLNTCAVIAANLRDSILFRQPNTYYERKLIAKTMISKTHLKIPVILDGPQNEWLNSFGPMPFLSYLIDNNGIVKAKFSAFTKNRNAILESLSPFK